MNETASCPHVAHAHATFSFEGATVNLMTDTPDELLASLAKFGIGKSPAATTKETKPAEKSKDAVAASAEPARTPEPKPDADAKASAPAEQPKPKEVPYTELQAAVFKLAALAQKKGVDKDEWVISIAKKHGGENFKALKPDTYAAALADVTAQVAKLEALEEAVA